MTSEALDTAALDAQLAEKLFGWTKIEQHCHLTYEWCGIEPGMTECAEPPRYSTTGDRMLTVQRAMKERGWRWACYDAPAGETASFAKTAKDGTHIERHASEPSLPTAVARAALAAIGDDHDE